MTLQEKLSTTPVTKSFDGTSTAVQIAPSNAFVPGLYTITVSDPQGDTNSQNFTWGVLALNTDKTMYHPGETGDISMAVLDDKGNMVCDAGLTLQITNTSSSASALLQTGTPGQNSIMVNPSCQSHDFSLQPDYEAHYQFQDTGTYTLTLTAHTQQGERSITSVIKVTNQIPFDVQRISSTRIYPPNTYPMTVNITAHQDFSGTITETVPQDFVITPGTMSATPSHSYTNMQTVYINSPDPSYLLQQDFPPQG